MSDAAHDNASPAPSAETTGAPGAAAGAAAPGSTATLPPAVAAQVQEWLDTFDREDACAAELLCDRYDRDAVAFRFIDTDMSTVDLTFGELSDRSARVAAGLAARGVQQGDAVPLMMAKREELVITMMAVWRLGAVHVPLFTAFATGAAQMRIEGSGAKLVVASPDQAEKLTSIEGIEILRTGEEWDELEQHEPLAEPVAVGGHGVLALLFTSGTTGKPKGVPVPLRAMAAFSDYLHYSVDVREDDVFWNAADHGWAYGLYYGIMGPLALGRTSLQYRAGFSPESMAQVIREQGVTNFAGAPTMYRALAKSGLVEGPESALKLRRAASAGEPLPPSMVAWGHEALGCEICDQYGQTELGMVICNNAHPDVAQPVKPGSMGLPMPGITGGIEHGQIALDTEASPMFWFPGYLDSPDKTASRFSEDRRWYLTGDTGRMDEDGYFFFSSRDDDVILAAGYRIGPFDVESVLITHPLVQEVAVVGRPDPEGIRGEVVEAFVVLTEEVENPDVLEAELKTKVRDEYSKHAYPRRVHIVEDLPKTPSGKVQRYKLRKGELS